MNDKQSIKKFRDERVLQIIDKCIALKDTSLNNEILKKVLDEVLTAMKKHDDFFREFFQAPVYVGSYYKGTKVGKAEEFDVNLIIQLPLNYEFIMFETDIPGFTKLKLNDTCYKRKWETHKKIMSKWIDNNQYLNQDKFRQSMEGKFTIAMQNLPENKNYKLRLLKSGPAFTLFVNYKDSLEMKVDLVPVLAFNRRPPLPGVSGNGEWYAVPKPFKNGVGTNVHLHWRLSFYKHEQEMLRKNGYLKPALRQIKKLRDIEDWKIIPSYHIETLFMHHIKATEEYPSLLKMQRLELLIHMLHRLKEACETGTIANFWENRHNLMEANRTQLASVIGRLGKIIKQVNENPLVIRMYFLTKDELVEYEEDFNAIPASCDTQSTGSLYVQPANINKMTEASTSSGEEETGSRWPLLLATAANIAMQLTTPNPSDLPEASTFNRDDRNSGSKEILDTMKVIRDEIVAMRQSLDQLSRRMTSVERKVDSLLPDGNVRRELIPDNDTPRNWFDSAHMFLNTIQDISQTP